MYLRGDSLTTSTDVNHRNLHNSLSLVRFFSDRTGFYARISLHEHNSRCGGVCSAGPTPLMPRVDEKKSGNLIKPILVRETFITEKFARRTSP